MAFSDNVEHDGAMVANGAVIAAYGTRDADRLFQFWPLLFGNVTMRLLGSDDFPAEAEQQAAADFTGCSVGTSVSAVVAEMLQLGRLAAGDDPVDSGGQGRVLVRADRSAGVTSSAEIGASSVRQLVAW